MALFINKMQLQLLLLLLFTVIIKMHQRHKAVKAERGLFAAHRDFLGGTDGSKTTFFFFVFLNRNFSV